MPAMNCMFRVLYQVIQLQHERVLRLSSIRDRILGQCCSCVAVRVGKIIKQSSVHHSFLELRLAFTCVSQTQKAKKSMILHLGDRPNLRIKLITRSQIVLLLDSAEMLRSPAVLGQPNGAL